MDFNIDIITILGIGISFMSLFISLFFILKNKLKNDGYIFLYLSMLIISYEMFYKTMIHSRLLYDYPELYLPGRFQNLIIYPIFLCFVWSVIKKKIKVKLAFLLLIGFILYGFYVHINAWIIPLDDKVQMLNSFYADNRPGPFNYWANTETLIKGTLIPLVFLGVTGFYFFSFRNKISSIKNKLLLNILSSVIVLYFLYNQFSNLLYQLVYEFTNFSMVEWPVDIFFLSILLMLFSMIAMMVNTGVTFLPPTKYSRSLLQVGIYGEILSKAEKLIEEHQLYKEQSLTLGELSKKVGTNSKYLSQAINHQLELSYVDYINGYRIEEAKSQLLNPKNAQLTIEAIGEIAGFNSKTAFFRAFKKKTNLTPNQFIKNKRSSIS
tara:strand:+ start:7255 stop:8391 length:1137 start_codon:yes stop_codon:yes gene_type:complete